MKKLNKHLNEFWMKKSLISQDVMKWNWKIKNWINKFQISIVWNFYFLLKFNFSLGGWCWLCIAVMVLFSLESRASSLNLREVVENQKKITNFHVSPSTSQVTARRRQTSSTRDWRLVNSLETFSFFGFIGSIEKHDISSRGTGNWQEFWNFWYFKLEESNDDSFFHFLLSIQIGCRNNSVHQNFTHHLSPFSAQTTSE